MSYDLFFFALPKNVEVEEVNEWLGEEAERLQAEDEAFVEEGNGSSWENVDDDEEDDEPLLPPRFVESKFEHEEFAALLIKPFLRAMGPEAFSATDLDEVEVSEVTTWLNSDVEEVPEILDEMMEQVFEFSMDGGMFPMVFGFTDELPELAANIVSLLEDSTLSRHRICIFDPQANLVLTANDAEIAREAAVEALEMTREIFEQLAGTDPNFQPELDTDAGPQIVATAFAEEGVESGKSKTLCSAARLFLILPVFDFCFEALEGYTEPLKENTIAPAELVEWVRQLAGDEYAEMDDLTMSVAYKTATALGIEISTPCFDLSVKRFATAVFLIGAPSSAEELFPPWQLLAFSLNLIEVVGEEWVDGNPQRERQLKLATEFMEAYLDICDVSEESEKRIAVSFVE